MDILNQLRALIDGPKLITLFGLIGLDTILGIALAIKNGTFQWSKLAQFLDTSVLSLAGGYLALGVAAVINPSLRVGIIPAWAALTGKLIADIGSKLKQFGVPLPSLTFKKKPPAPPPS